MTSGIRTFIYPVKDLAQAKTLYGQLLGVKPDLDEAYYVGFSVDGQHVGLNPHGHSQGMTGPVGYCHVDDIKKSLADPISSPNPHPFLLTPPAIQRTLSASLPSPSRRRGHEAEGDRDARSGDYLPAQGSESERLPQDLR